MTALNRLRAGLVLAPLLAFAAAPLPARAACPIEGQSPMLVMQLFFGQSMDGGGTVSAAEWSDFMAGTVTPAFPDGLTVYDANGQWWDDQAKSVGREPTKVVMIAVPKDADVKDKLKSVVQTYVKRFHQQSVGIVTNEACAAF